MTFRIHLLIFVAGFHWSKATVAFWKLSPAHPDSLLKIPLAVFIQHFNKVSEYILAHKSIVYIYWVVVFAIFLFGQALGAILFGDNSAFLVLKAIVLLIAVGLFPLVILVAAITRSWPRIYYLVQWNLLAFVVCFVTASLILLSEDKLVDFFRGKPRIVAYYRGNQQRAELTLRDDNKFDILVVGYPFDRAFFHGKYEIQSDIVVYRFSSEPPAEFNGRGQIVRSSDGMLHIYILRGDSGHDRADFVVRKNYQENVLQFAPRIEKQ